MNRAMRKWKKIGLWFFIIQGGGGQDHEPHLDMEIQICWFQKRHLSSRSCAPFSSPSSRITEVSHSSSDSYLLIIFDWFHHHTSLILYFCRLIDEATEACLLAHDAEGVARRARSRADKLMYKLERAVSEWIKSLTFQLLFIEHSFFFITIVFSVWGNYEEGGRGWKEHFDCWYGDRRQKKEEE